eukprot:14744321-Heterocapsa_arctica.AAC.1
MIARRPRELAAGPHLPIFPSAGSRRDKPPTGAMAAADLPTLAAASQAFQTMGEEFGIENKMIAWLTSPTGLGA